MALSIVMKHYLNKFKKKSSTEKIQATQITMKVRSIARDERKALKK